jgi:phosphoglycolate phosphatase
VADRPPRAILFDLDGCLVDSTVPISECLNAALVDVGIEPMSPDELRPRIGPPLQVMLETLFAERGADPTLIPSVIEGYRSRYSTESVRLAASYAGVPELVAALAATERLAVCTSKPRRFAVPILEQLGMARHFAHIEGPGLTEVEPKTVTMERLRRVLPLDPSASVMVGDRHHDVEAALAHGLLPVGVTWGFGSRDELEAAGAVSVIDRPDELHEVLAGLG